jgi:hypothetical protein
MKVIIEKKEFVKEFEYYKDTVGVKEDEILDVRFWNEGIELDVDEIEIVIGRAKKEEPSKKGNTISIEDYEMLAGENKCFAEFLKKQGYSDVMINDIANGSL